MEAYKDRRFIWCFVSSYTKWALFYFWSQNWNNVVNKKPSGDFIGVIVAEVSQDGFLFYKYL